MCDPMQLIREQKTDTMPTMANERRYQALADLITARRQEMRLNQEQAIRTVGISKATWYKAVGKSDGSVQPGKVSSGTYERLERGLGWASGSIQAYLAGGPEPRPGRPQQERRRHLDVTDLLAAVERSPLQPRAKDHLRMQVQLLSQLPEPDFFVPSQNENGIDEH